MREDSQALATMNQPSTSQDATPTWLVDEDPRTNTVVMHLSAHVTATVVKAAIAAVTERLVARGGPSFVVADLSAVRSFDLAAPLVAVILAAPVAGLVTEVDIIATNKLVRAAATSVAAVLRLKVTVHPAEEH